MRTDITNLQILKAMYAAADAIIEAGYLFLKEPLTAAQIDKEIGKDNLATEGLANDGSNWLKAGSYEGFSLSDEGLTVNITVGSFSCSMSYASLFGMIAKIEKLCGVSASKAKKFANKQVNNNIQNHIIMKAFLNTKTFTREDALEVMANCLGMGNYIPSASIGQGGAGYCLIDPEFSIKEFAERVTRNNWSYRVVPVNEICDDLKDCDLDDYDVCVEFAQNPDGSGNCDNPPREQFLLWDVD